MLTLRQYAKSYNNQTLLSIEHVSFEQGVHWIKGENGSGKTTLFKSLAGIVPCEGEIAFDDGIGLKKDPVAYRKRINYSEAEPLYPGFLTAKDIVRFTAKIKGASTPQQETLCSAFGVNDFFDKPCETYSSGMMKKLALSLAFLGTPQLIILDEPLITLDEKARQVLFEKVKEQIDRGTILLVSSHQSISAQDIPVVDSFLIANNTIVRQ
jgi:ABC-2 type transport system ATP-binding protein